MILGVGVDLISVARIEKLLAQLPEKYPEKIKLVCYTFVDYKNFSINSPIFEIDYDAIMKRCSIYKEELMAIALHPSRIEKYLALGINIEELDNYI